MDVREAIRQMKSVAAKLANPIPRNVHTDELFNAHIDAGIKNLLALKIAYPDVEVTTAADAQKTLDLDKIEDEAPAKRKRKSNDPNRMHTGGQDREG